MWSWVDGWVGKYLRGVGSEKGIWLKYYVTFSKNKEKIKKKLTSNITQLLQYLTSLPESLSSVHDSNANTRELEEGKEIKS